jgi:hypothetical protein
MPKSYTNHIILEQYSIKISLFSSATFIAYRLTVAIKIIHCVHNLDEMLKKLAERARNEYKWTAESDSGYLAISSYSGCVTASSSDISSMVIQKNAIQLVPSACSRKPFGEQSSHSRKVFMTQLVLYHTSSWQGLAAIKYQNVNLEALEFEVY